MARKAKMRLVKGWVWAVLAVATLAVGELPRFDPIEVEVIAEPVLTVKARPVLAKLYDVQEAAPAQVVSADSGRVWAQMDVALAPWRLEKGDAVQPIGWSVFGVDAKTRASAQNPTVAAVMMEWWLTPEPVWQGGPLGRLRSRADAERNEGRPESAERYQREYWSAYVQALERRKVFQTADPRQTERRTQK